jgi:ABC-type multidrug transport system fused ATPase/permease subunit
MSLVNLLKRLWIQLETKRRTQYKTLLMLMIFVTFSELVSIGAVIPFLMVMTEPERIFEMSFAQPIVEKLQIENKKQLILLVTISFGLTTLIAGCIRLLFIWLSTKLSFATGADLSIKIYRKTLYQPYHTHCMRNSSNIIDGIGSKTNTVIYNILMPTITIISSMILIVSFLTFLVMMGNFNALMAIGFFGILYFAIISLCKKQINIDSKSIAKESSHIIKLLQEGLGGIRDILIDGSQEVYCKIYKKSDATLRRAQGNIIFIASSPRYAMEALGIIFIITLAYFLNQTTNGINSSIPILGALALGAQRMLPILQQGYSSWININGGRDTLIETIELLEQPLPLHNDFTQKEMVFNNEIKIKNIKFSYSINTPNVIDNLSLTINKGSRVGFIGKTGSGKSTLLDIIMGLLRPNAGTIEVDGQIITLENYRSWQVNIAHVPQTIFLADTTIEENIAFGIPENKIDRSKVKKAAKEAQIEELIEGWPNKYSTFVGERGIRLSGGQRQRIGIARALYKDAKVIIFDEATSALDGETEKAIMETINSIGKEITVLIIAHRLTTLQECDEIFELTNGSIIESKI